MNDLLQQIDQVKELLLLRLPELTEKKDILKAPELRALYAQLPTLAQSERAPYGSALNQLKTDLNDMINTADDQANELPALDVTAPFDLNAQPPQLLPAEVGSMHPLMAELREILDVFYRMGFTTVESREIDDDFNMFNALNFPEDHPARDDFDTFMTDQIDQDGKSLIAPAHTSTMQNRVLKAGKKQLESGLPIAAVIPGRVFRNEDLDARHEHTFYQLEGVFVSKNVHAGMLIATLQTFLQEYYGNSEIKVRTQPYYFPFTEPSLELALSCPFCNTAGCSVCSQSGWIELLGCGMIHPNVLRHADIDPNVYTGFAWGCGVERLVMMKYGIEDVRHFKSGKLEFLRQFA